MSARPLGLDRHLSRFRGISNNNPPGASDTTSAVIWLGVSCSVNGPVAAPATTSAGWVCFMVGRASLFDRRAVFDRDRVATKDLSGLASMVGRVKEAMLLMMKEVLRGRLPKLHPNRLAGPMSQTEPNTFEECGTSPLWSTIRLYR